MIATSWVPSDVQRGGAPAPRVLVNQTIATVLQMSKNQHAQNNQEARWYHDIHAAVLAGGESKRFGSDKCLATLAGDDRTFLDRAIGACREIAGRVVVVGGERSSIAGFADAVIPDSIGHEGPLVGLAGALLDCRAPFLLLTACDQPLVSGAILRRLAEPRSKADVVAFARDDGVPNPVPSLLRRDVLLPFVEECLRAGERSLRSIFSSGELRILAVEASARERAVLQDVDSQADLERLRALLPLDNDTVQ
jgi:molybdenum cofactor guanylyltransferase